MSDDSNFDENGRFKAGNTVGKPGRPKGARNRLGEAFLTDLEASWKEHGVNAINAVIKDRPQDYLKVVAGLLPSESHIKVSQYDDMSDEQLIERLRRLHA